MKKLIILAAVAIAVACNSPKDPEEDKLPPPVDTTQPVVDTLITK